MTRSLSRLGGVAAVALSLTVAALSFEPGALASPAAPSRIRPHQSFAGLVNGKAQDAVVKVVCPGPASTGRALPGQTLAVTRAAAVASNSGYTGSRSRAIAATVGGSGAVVSVLFKQYNQPAEFPTNVPLPCGGMGIVVFTPVPGSPGARSATVRVEYANVATTGPSAVSRR